ncbi:acyl-CoA synthetase [Streptomyces rubellomurinus]|uniref:Acyl-CoA synthetase n=2 Tax=Streptomyces TaxID=1883 RepID=A0A0F2T7X2_STRR3|nr:acyl-CoA synthetase [Streptomyces rubellomurinus]KJS54249.1 acyl-CoA synthetase [Streptomyces rubellomurinus subsp. indigoferus]KJS57832.1 acyl-CoA synthetase [Streptomyces rubellomurinus]
MALLTALQGGFGDTADALRIDGRALSREDLLGAATAVADRAAGAPALAVLARPTVETVVAVVGGLLAGVPVVPLPPDSGPKEREHILRDSGAALLAHAVGEDVPEGVPGLPVDPAERSATSHPEPAADSTGFVLYTSGTTGAPKGAVIRREAIAADLDALAAAWQWTAEDTLAHGLPLFHVHGLLLGVLGALRTGSRLVHTGRPTPAGYAAAGASLYFGVPTVWSRLAADPEAAGRLASARLLVSGSAPLPVPVFEKLAALTGHAPIERYGMTESLITVSTRADGERRPGSVGLPVDGVRTRLVGEDGAPVPYDGESVGELQVAGPTLFSGYLNRPDADAEAWTADGWFRTGDVAVIGADGFHRIVGRASVDLIKSGGYRIGAGEVEAALRDHPAVADAAVVGAPDEDLGQAIVAYVVPDGAVTGDQLTAFVAERLSVHKRPRRVVLVPELPRNALGKVLKKQLLAEHGGR